MVAQIQSIAIAGGGRVASAILRSLPPCQPSVLGVHVRSAARWADLRAQALLPDSARNLELAELFQADAIFIAVADDAFEAFVQALLAEDPGPQQRKTRFVIHASGSKGQAGLAPFEDRGLELAMMHPLRSLPEGSRLDASPLVIQGDEEARESLCALAECMGARPLWCPDLDPALYHAAAALLANGFTALFSAGLQLLRKAGGDSLGQREALDLVVSALDPLESMMPEAALTGPVHRGDARLVSLHLQALGEGAPELLPLYRALMREALVIAGRGGLDPEKCHALEALLQSP